MKVPTERLREMLALAEAAKPVEPRDLMAYEHGGGRLAIIRDGKRDLIADFYGDGQDRDHYAACDPATIRSALSELLELREAVKPFALAAECIEDTDGDRIEMWEHPASMQVTAGDFRRAARSLQSHTGEA